MAIANDTIRIDRLIRASGRIHSIPSLSQMNS
jgi:hypothetical protein